MTALLTDPFTFDMEYSAHSFEPGGSSHIQEQPFSTPHQPIPPVQSPMWDLNSPPTVTRSPLRQQPDDDDDAEEEEAQLALRRPQRVRRRPRCGTGSHYFDE